jgi:uncharacterized membrane protein YphA (DoxX/SURF4 family)
VSMLQVFARNPLHYLVVFARYYFGLHSLASGANYFLNFTPTGKMVHPLATPFFDSMVDVGLYGIVKSIELVVGVCLVTNVFVPLALILEFPISLNIFFLSTVVIGKYPNNITGAKELFLNLFLFAGYAKYYMSILAIRATPGPIWDRAVARRAFKTDSP